MYHRYLIKIKVDHNRIISKSSHTMHRGQSVFIIFMWIIVDSNPSNFQCFSSFPLYIYWPILSPFVLMWFQTYLFCYAFSAASWECQVHSLPYQAGKLGPIWSTWQQTNNIDIFQLWCFLFIWPEVRPYFWEIGNIQQVNKTVAPCLKNKA